MLEAGSTAAAGGGKGGQEEEKMDTLTSSSVAREDAMWMEKALVLAAMAEQDGEVGALAAPAGHSRLQAQGGG